MLAIQGDTVTADVHGRELRATAVGPDVPVAARRGSGVAVPATFTVTMRGAGSATAIRPAALTIVDELGRLHHPRVTIARHGRTVTLTVHDALPVGNGQLRWAPDGGRPLVAWDFDLELI